MTAWTRRHWLRAAGAFAVVGIGVSAAAGCWRLPAGPSASKVPRIGYLGSDSRPGFDRMAALERGLRELGFIENQNIVIERRLSQDQTGAAFESLAAELLALQVQVIVTSGTPSVLAAAHATRSIPIVAAGPHRSLRDLRLVDNLARPGGNVTGLEVDLGLESKRVELLHQVIPTATRIGVMHNPATPGTLEQVNRVKEIADGFGLEAVVLPLSAPSELDSLFDSAANARVEGTIVFGDFVFGDPSGWRVVDLARERRLPAMYTQTQGYVDQGGLMAYASDYIAFHHRAATYVDKLLRGVNPAELPVEQTTLFEFSLNVKAAEAIALKIPKHVLLQATRVIQ